MHEKFKSVFYKAIHLKMLEWTVYISVNSRDFENSVCRDFILWNIELSIGTNIDCIN